MYENHQGVKQGKFTQNIQIGASKGCMDWVINPDVTQENYYILKLEYAYYSEWTFSNLAFICSSFYFSQKLHHVTHVADIMSFKSKHITSKTLKKPKSLKEIPKLYTLTQLAAFPD